MAEYEELKSLALKSARDFLTMYEAVPDKDKSVLPVRQTFYGEIPRSAYEMYEHTKNVNAYYFGEIGVQADNNGTIEECRKRGFELLEHQPEFWRIKFILEAMMKNGHCGRWQYVVLVVYFDMRLYYSSDYDNCGQNDVETLSKEDQWSCGIPN